jgi:hypothetical protein
LEGYQGHKNIAAISSAGTGGAVVLIFAEIASWADNDGQSEEHGR